MKSCFPGFLCRALVLTHIIFITAAVLVTEGQVQQQSQQQAKATLEAAVQAAGGVTLGKIQSIELNVRRTVFLQGHKQGQSDVDMRLVYPGRMRLEMKTIETQVLGGYGSSGTPARMQRDPGLMPPPGGPITPMTLSEHAGFTYVEGCDGRMWWRKSVGDTELRVADIRTNLRINLTGAMGMYRRAAQGNLDGKYVGELQVQGRLVQVLVLADDGTKLYFDPQTHQLVGAAYLGMNAGDAFDAFHWWTDYVMKVSAVDAGREQSIWWSDFRRIKLGPKGEEEWIQFPFLWITYIDGIKFMEERVTRLKLNPKQNPKIFQAPK